jgi:hypothetical protein
MDSPWMYVWIICDSTNKNLDSMEYDGDVTGI